MYTDTDLLIYYTITNNFYEDSLNKSCLLECMDTSNLPKDHACCTSACKKILGLLSDKTAGRIIREYCPSSKSLRVENW